MDLTSDTKNRLLFGVVGFILGCLLVGLFFLIKQLNKTEAALQVKQTSEVQTLLDRYALNIAQHEALLNTLYNQAYVDDEEFKKFTPEVRKKVLLNNARTFNAAVDSIFLRTWTLTKDSLFTKPGSNSPTNKPNN